MQKTILRNGLIAALFAFIMVVAFMPQKASATTSVPPLSLSGYVVNFDASYTEDVDTYNAGKIVIAGKYASHEAYELTAGTTSYDLSEYVAKEVAANVDEETGDNTVGITVLVRYYKEGSTTVYEDSKALFYFVSIDAQATTASAVTEDTTFEYEVEEVVDTIVTNAAEKRTAKFASLAENKLTIKKGDTVSSALQKLVLALNVTAVKLAMDKDEYLLWLNIKEKDVNKKYAVSSNEYGVIVKYGAMEQIYDVVRGNHPDTFNSDQRTVIIDYNTEKGVDDVINKYNNAIDEFVELMKGSKILNAKDATVAATFKHGVPTADNSDLALWIALFAIATVCGGAVALKKN